MDTNDELAALEASSAMAITATPPAAPASTGEFQPDPVPGTVVDVTALSFLPTPPPAVPAAPEPAPAPAAPPVPVAPAAPAPAEPPAAPSPTPQAPAAPEAPAPNPVNQDVPEKLQRRVYLHDGMSEGTKLLIQLAAINPGLSPDELTTVVNQRLGITPRPGPAPSAPGTPPAAPEAPLVTYESASTRLDAVQAELENLDPVLDTARWKELDSEHRRLVRQLPSLQVQVAQQQAQEAVTLDQTIAASRANAEADYPDLQNPNSELALAFAEQFYAHVHAESHLANLPNFEEVLAREVATSMGILPNKTPNRTAPPAAPAPSQPAPSPAAPAPAPASPAAPAPGHAPAAGMPPVSGLLGSSADRVTTVPQNQSAAIEAQYHQAVADGDFAKMAELDSLRLNGGQAPQAGPGLQISYTSAA